MTALAMLLFPLGAWMIVSRSFDLTMERERARALSEEAAISRAVSMEIKDGNYETLYAVASSAQARYGSDTLSVMMIYHEHAMANMQAPEIAGMGELLSTQSRATLLDGESKTLFIAHRLKDGIVLLLGSDVSAAYDFRREMMIWAGALSLCGVLLSAALSVIVSGYLAKPFKLLAQQRQELIDALAHEMRTPLTAILGGVRLLERASLTQENRAALLDSMAKETQRLSDMDERLLMLTRLEHDALVFSAFSSMEMAKEALAVFDGVKLGGEDTVFTAERELTILLLRNLTVNALRAGGNAPVRVTMLADGFSVSDNGCGMTKEQMDRAFEPFYRADKSRARAQGGAGLGLTLCRRIAQLHGGRLDITSKPGQGTTVVYRFVTTP